LRYFFWVKIRHIIVEPWQNVLGLRICFAAWFSVNNSGGGGLFLAQGRKPMAGLYHFIHRQDFSEGKQLGV